MVLNFSPIDETSARNILAWRYEPPYDFYNSSGSVDADLPTLLDPHNFYYALTNEQTELVAYLCFGQDAQVPGGDYRSDALDVGGGLRPDLTGHGFGSTLITAGLDFARSSFSPSAFRATVAAFNERALRVCQKAGFQAVQNFKSCADGKEFVVLLREA